MDLWEEEFDDNFKGELNAETLQKVQRELQVDLPESYINVLNKRNGFYLKKKYFPTCIPNSWANNSVYVDALFGIGEDSGLIDTIYLRKEWGIRSKKLVIISSGLLRLYAWIIDVEKIQLLLLSMLKQIKR
ncbi:SMI1/KNR4 family protein [Peribacillus sp. NPDC058075]|uniref:SMI1/KNR4 family protein n=1 Tax=unclassified Peribacillus TaxID=2675266 RepID=UPI0036DA068E